MLTLGVCLEASGERFLILTEGDREINLPESRFLHVAPHALNVQKGRDQLIQSLRDIAKHREELRLRIDLAEVWELVWAEPEAYDCAFLAGLVFGEEVTPDHTAAMYRACWDDTIHLPAKRIPSSPTLQRQSNSSCIKRFAKPSANTSTAAAAFVKTIWEGYAPTPAELAAQGTWIELLKEYALHDTEAPRYRLARDLLNRAEVTLPMRRSDCWFASACGMRTKICCCCGWVYPRVLAPRCCRRRHTRRAKPPRGK